MALEGLAAAQHPQLRIASPASFNQKLPRRRRRLQNASSSARFSKENSKWPSLVSSSSAITTLAPTVSGRKSSNAAMSKQMVVTATIVSGP